MENAAGENHVTLKLLDRIFQEWIVMPEDGPLTNAFLKKDQSPLCFRPIDHSNVIRGESGFTQAAQLCLAEIVVPNGTDVFRLQAKARAGGHRRGDLAS